MAHLEISKKQLLFLFQTVCVRTCERHSDEEVCGMDGKSHRNSCLLESSNCVEILHEGPCKTLRKRPIIGKTPLIQNKNKLSSNRQYLLLLCLFKPAYPRVKLLISYLRWWQRIILDRKVVSSSLPPFIWEEKTLGHNWYQTWVILLHKRLLKPLDHSSSAIYIY